MDYIAEPCAHCFPQPFVVEAAGHAFEFLPDGVHRFDALLAMIERAKETLDLFYYMFQDDAAGEMVRDALVAAQRRGVRVHLVIDRFGSDAKREFFQPIVDAGGRFAMFNPKINVRYLIRNHQKMTIIDRKVALLGGFNVSEHYFQPPEENGWADLGVVLRGPVVEDICRWFGKLSAWTEQPRRQFRAIRRLVRDWDPGEGPVQFLVGGPTRTPSTWSRAVKRDLVRGRRLDMVMAYFSPPRSFRRLLRKLANRGRARLVMAGKSDNGTTIAAARATYGALMRSRAQIYEFQPCKLHMKLIVIDDVVYFGSANFDHRSIRVNLELMVRVESAEMAEKVREMVDTMVEASEEITPEILRQRRGLLGGFRWLLGWFLVSVVDYTVARRLNA